MRTKALGQSALLLLDVAQTDACATLSQERHESSLRNNRGDCRQLTTQALLEEIASLKRRVT